MAIDACILAKAAAGVVDERKAKRLAAEVAARLQEMEADTGIKSPAAQRVMGQRLVQEKLRILARKKRLAVLHKRKLAELDADYRNAIDRGYGVDNAMKARYSQDLARRIPDVDDIESRTAAVRGAYHARVEGVLERFRSKYAGLSRNLEGLEDVIHVMFGKYGKNVSGEAAQSMGKALRDMLEYARTRYNAAGGDIPLRDDWGFFQNHDPVRMAAVPKDEWVDFTMARLSHDRTLDANGLPMSEKRLRRSVEEVYDSAVSRGLKDLSPARAATAFGSNVNVRANARFLVFKDSTAWLEYHQAYGKGGLYEHIITSMDRLARDTAVLEVLGPYPQAALRRQEQLIDKALAEDAISKTGKAAEKVAGRIGAPKTQLQNLFNSVTGRTGIPANESLAAWSGSVRAVMTAATLGGAFLSAVADIATTGLTARMAGMPVMDVWKRMARTFVLNSTADRRLAVNLGFAAQGWASRAIGSQRLLGEATGHKWAELLTDTALRASFLTPWTEAGRFAFQVEALTFITSQAGKSFDKLPGALRRVFDTHGLTEEMWEVIRKTDQWVDPDSGASFLRAEDVMAGEFEGARFEAANKLQDVILRELEYAVPGANVRVRAAFSASQPAGTLWGEVMRSATMFKSFPLSIMAMHWTRLFAAKEGSFATKAEYAAWLFGGMTMMGMIGEQLTDISRGRDPEPLTSPSLGVRAFIRGGSGGLLADTLLQEGRYGVSLDSLAGPIWSMAAQGINLTAGNLRQYLQGNETNAGRDLSKFIEQMVPGRSMWYARLAFERLLFDQLDRALDPKADQEFNRIMRQYRKERGQEFFAKPGRARADRLPDFGKLFEEAP